MTNSAPSLTAALTSGKASEYMVKPSSDGIKLTIQNKKGSKGSGGGGGGGGSKSSGGSSGGKSSLKAGISGGPLSAKGLQQQPNHTTSFSGAFPSSTKSPHYTSTGGSSSKAPFQKSNSFGSLSGTGGTIGGGGGGGGMKSKVSSPKSTSNPGNSSIYSSSGGSKEKGSSGLSGGRSKSSSAASLAGSMLSASSAGGTSSAGSSALVNPISIMKMLCHPQGGLGSMEGFAKSLDTKFQIPKLSARTGNTTGNATGGGGNGTGAVTNLPGGDTAVPSSEGNKPTTRPGEPVARKQKQAFSTNLQQQQQQTQSMPVVSASSLRQFSPSPSGGSNDGNASAMANASTRLLSDLLGAAAAAKNASKMGPGSANASGNGGSDGLHPLLPNIVQKMFGSDGSLLTKSNSSDGSMFPGGGRASPGILAGGGGTRDGYRSSGGSAPGTPTATTAPSLVLPPFPSPVSNDGVDLGSTLMRPPSRPSSTISNHSHSSQDGMPSGGLGEALGGAGVGGQPSPSMASMMMNAVLAAGGQSPIPLDSTSTQQLMAALAVKSVGTGGGGGGGGGGNAGGNLLNHSNNHLNHQNHHNHLHNHMVGGGVSTGVPLKNHPSPASVSVHIVKSPAPSPLPFASPLSNSSSSHGPASAGGVGSGGIAGGGASAAGGIDDDLLDEALIGISSK